MKWVVAAGIWVVIIMANIDFSSIGVAQAVPGTTEALTAVAAISANPFTRFFKLGLLGLGVLVIGSHMGLFRQYLRRLNPYFMAYLVLAICSTAWSIDPGATINRFISLMAIVMGAVAFSLAEWNATRLQDVVRPLLTILLLASFLYDVLEPQLAIDFDRAGYHGLSGQKNPFGELAAFGTLIWMHALISRQVSFGKAALGALLGWACLWQSKSATSMLATAFASGLMVMLLRTSPAVRRYSPYLIGGFATLIVAYAMAVLNLVPGLATLLLSPIMAITGKDMTFSNRAQIWQIIEAHINLHPLLGTGFGAYWTAAVPSSPSYIFLGLMYFWPSESHNGYLEVVNDLGFVGMICLLLYLVHYVRQALRLYRLDRPNAALYLGIFFQQALNNLSESGWFAANGVLLVAVTVMATCCLARSVVDAEANRGAQVAGGSARGLRRTAGARG